MCGIAGIYNFNSVLKEERQRVENAVDSLKKRGPNDRGVFQNGKACLGHTRLSIIDTSHNASQPLSEKSGRYTIVYNGEIYNFKELKKELVESGYHFQSESDTEVLLNLYAAYGKDCLQMINGFFAFAIYDKKEDSLFLARDRFGIKPLLVYSDDEKFAFASEMKALSELGITRELDEYAMFLYFQLTYIPSPHSIFKKVKKLSPGHYMELKGDECTEKEYYNLDEAKTPVPPSSYAEAKQQLRDLLKSSVEKRLIADVPVGTFLSGGIDSSVITAVASRAKKNLKTFSIGFSSAFHDEVPHAETVARQFNTDHTSIYVSHEDLLEGLDDLIEYIDEPFADSSVLAVNLLCKNARPEITVALSGDGADEVFSGYEKHKAEYMARHGGWKKDMVKALQPLWKKLPRSRGGSFGNKIRQLSRFAAAAGLEADERYWQWACIAGEEDVRKLLRFELTENDIRERKKRYTKYLDEEDMNGVLLADIHLVLQGDMLRKVDLASMNNSLEVRVPFLDHRIVEFARSLPASYKIDSKKRKKILREAYMKELPEEILNRPKHGFEIPLHGWMKRELQGELEELTQRDFIEEQEIFNFKHVEKLKKQFHSASPGDSQAMLWSIFVFNKWYHKYFL